MRKIALAIIIVVVLVGGSFIAGALYNAPAESEKLSYCGEHLTYKVPIDDRLYLTFKPEDRKNQFVYQGAYQGVTYTLTIRSWDRHTADLTTSEGGKETIGFPFFPKDCKGEVMGEMY